MNSRSIYGSRKAPLTLDIIIVGCGIGGLSAAFCLVQAGHRVTMVDSASTMGPEVGAGILLSPNSTRLLQRWGSGEVLDEVAVRPYGALVRRYDTGEQVGFTKWGETSLKDYGAPHLQIHRADLHKLLHDLVAPHVTILLDSLVVNCDPNPTSPSVTFESGKVLKADLIVGADGLKSYIQEVVLGKPNRADPTGDAVWRALVPTSLMKGDPELNELVENPHLNAWLAPGRHLVGYPVRRKELYNLVIAHKYDGDAVESWTAEDGADEMRRVFDDYEPRVKKILKLVQKTLRFRLMDRQPLEKWTHDSGRVTLLGDACHPMLPYRAQGAAMAIEDGAVLGNLLSRISDISQLKPLLNAYQDLRHERTAEVQAASRTNQRVYHLPDGEEQKRRDENLKKAMALEVTGNTAELRRQPPTDQSPGLRKQKDDELYNYDADAEVDKWWASHGKKIDALVRSKFLRFTRSDVALGCIACFCVCVFMFL